MALPPIGGYQVSGEQPPAPAPNPAAPQPTPSPEPVRGSTGFGYGGSPSLPHEPGTGYTGDISRHASGGLLTPNSGVGAEYNPLSPGQPLPSPQQQGVPRGGLLGDALGAAQAGGQLGPDVLGQAPAAAAGPTGPDPYSLQGQGAAELEAQRQRERLRTPGAFEGLGPGQGQGFVYDQLNQFGGQAGAANPTAQAYQDFQANRPDLMKDANLGSYYDNAQRQMLEGINQNAAARGAYGSSAALAEGNEGIMNLRAQQANREADYQLQRAAEQRAWEATGGQLAAGQSAAQQRWAQGLGDQGLKADYQRAELAASQDQAELNRLDQGLRGADTEQRAREKRINDMLNHQYNREALYLPQVMDWQGNTFAGDAGLFSAGQGGNIGATTAEVNIDEANKGQFLEDTGATADIVSSLYGGGSGVLGGKGKAAPPKAGK